MMYLRAAASPPTVPGHSASREGRRAGPGRAVYSFASSISTERSVRRTSAAPRTATKAAKAAMRTPSTYSPSSTMPATASQGQGQGRHTGSARRPAGHVSAEVEYAIRLFNGSASPRTRRPPPPGSGAPPTSATSSRRTVSPASSPPAGASRPTPRRRQVPLPRQACGQQDQFLDDFVAGLAPETAPDRRSPPPTLARELMPLPVRPLRSMVERRPRSLLHRFAVPLPR